MKDPELTEEDWAVWHEEVRLFLEHWREGHFTSDGMILLADPPFSPTPKAVREARARGWRRVMRRVMH